MHEASIEGVPRMLVQTSRVYFSHQNREHVSRNGQFLSVKDYNQQETP